MQTDARLEAIQLLNDFVALGDMTQPEADAALRDWDAVHYPRQVPEPQRRESAILAAAFREPDGEA